MSGMVSENMISTNQFNDWIPVTVFGSTLLMVVLLWSLVGLIPQWLDRRNIHKRLDKLVNGHLRSKNSKDDLQQWLMHVVSRSGFLVPGKSKDFQHTINRLKQAGYRTTSNIVSYYFIRFVLLITLPIAFNLYALLFAHLPTEKLMMYSIVSGGIGLLLPSYLLDKRVASRQKSIRNALPDALDLLVVCSEAGLGLNAALVRVGKEIKGIHPDLSLEFSLVTAEILGGFDRAQALNNMVERTGVQELKSLVLLINQTLKLGTSTADSLRIYSEEYRDTRMQQAEENAAKLSTKMIFPLVVCFLPCFFIVSVGPAAIKMMEALGMSK
jgi:tight adherence protein C